MDLRLKNKVAVVTGGASGIGLAIATALAEEGCHVACWDRSASVAAVASTIAEHGNALPVNGGKVKAIGCQVDITDRAQIAAALAKTTAELGPVELLAHAAAIGSGKFGFPFTNLSPDDWPRVLEVNIQGMVNVAHAITLGMVAQGSGAMLFIASVAGQIGSPTDPPYSASKAANINFAQCMAKDLAKENIRVNTLCPGMVKTELNRNVWQAWHDAQPVELRRTYEEWADDKVSKVVPLGRWQTASDIANMATFLLSPRASEVTGQTINVDGGFVMHW